jgi:hypothetical protein
MWTKLKWTFRGILAVLVIAVLHYNLPHHDVVRVTNTYNRQTTIGSNAFFYARAETPIAGVERRDIRFIEAVRPNGDVSVYRNEDTGWVWPPYFKYDSANLQAEASNLISTNDHPQWVVITHYGWRTPFFSVYPNAVNIYAVAGPDVWVFPWVSLIVLALLALGAGMVRRMWRQFRLRIFAPAAAE